MREISGRSILQMTDDPSSPDGFTAARRGQRTLVADFELECIFRRRGGLRAGLFVAGTEARPATQ